MNVVFLLLGANLGDRFRQLSQAKAGIEAGIGHVEEQSSVYETDAWGVQDQPAYLNQVLLVKTKLTPQALLKTIHEIEDRLGRRRINKWESRVIDIDILFYNDLVVEKEDLIIPHPYLHKRKFTLLPLAELTAGLWHPVLKKTVKQLLEELKDPLEVRRIENKA